MLVTMMKQLTIPPFSLYDSVCRCSLNLQCGSASYVFTLCDLHDGRHSIVASFPGLAQLSLNGASGACVGVWVWEGSGGEM